MTKFILTLALSLVLIAVTQSYALEVNVRTDLNTNKADVPAELNEDINSQVNSRVNEPNGSSIDVNNSANLDAHKSVRNTVNKLEDENNVNIQSKAKVKAGY